MKKNLMDVVDLLFCGFFTLIGLIVLSVGLIMVYSTTIISDFYRFPFLGGIMISFSAIIWVVQWGRKVVDAYRSLIKN